MSPTDLTTAKVTVFYVFHEILDNFALSPWDWIGVWDPETTLSTRRPSGVPLWSKLTKLLNLRAVMGQFCQKTQKYYCFYCFL